MNLTRALRFASTTSIAFTGAGGKTTALFRLAREGQPALVTASTHLGAWQIAQADRHVVWIPGRPMPEIDDLLRGGVSLITGELQDGRYAGLSPNEINQLHGLATEHRLPLLVEADGARQKPLKAPAGHEPPIPGFVDTVVVVAGLAGLGRPLTDETVHRAELFGKLIDLSLGGEITAEMLTAVLTHPDGGLKNIPKGTRKIALLNQADTAELTIQAGQMAGRLLSSFDTVVVASLEQDKIWSTHERIGAVVLAAGASSRFGKPKQLLDYHGRPFVRQVAQTALDAGLSPVVVVSGAHADKIEAAVAGTGVMVIRNEDWETGQSSSIHAGVKALPSGIGGAVFLLADQPQVTPNVIQALVERHALERGNIVAPLAADRRTNPVLFDRDTFEDLLAIRGDVGGRAIFSKYPVDYIVWHDERLLFDVDTEADYRKLLSWGVDE